MTNNYSSKLALLVIILSQNWQFWGPNSITNKKIGNFLPKYSYKAEYLKNLSISAKKLPNWQLLVQFWPQNYHFLLFVIRSLFTNKFNFYSLLANNENLNKI